MYVSNTTGMQLLQHISCGRGTVFMYVHYSQECAQRWSRPAERWQQLGRLHVQQPRGVVARRGGDIGED